MQSDSGRRNRLVTTTAYLLAIALIFALPVSVIAHNGIRVLFSSDALSEGISEILLQRGGIREQLVTEFYTSAWLGDINTIRSNPFQFLSSRDRLRIAQELFPDEWIKAQVRDGFEIIMEWLQIDDPTPKINLDFERVKQGLSEGRSKTIVEILVNSWPRCSGEQELSMQRSLQSDLPVNSEFCRPGGDLVVQLVDHLDGMLQEYVKNIQSDIPILGNVDETNYGNSLMDLKGQLLRLSLWLRWLRLSPLPLMGLIMSLVIRSWYEFGRWWGIPLMVGSLLGLVLIAVLDGITPSVINQALLDSGNQPGDIDSLRSVITSILERITEGSSAHLFLTFIVGAGLFGITWAYYRRHTEPKSRSVQEATNNLPEKREDVSPSDIPHERGIPSPPPVKLFDPEDLSDTDNDKPTGVFD